ncbi:Yip1 family protein [uncultured Roseicyclus sp.]|uniref:Yip1 family protein n=1 Tax=uncultured Roseicyclus sp. TaxID=543072 RepID=UPI0026200090|nr:Yip1 family protein [uncultured Roseicyclus sp.]
MSDLMQPGQLLRMARHTVSNPRDGAAVILKLHLPMRALWLAFGLVIVLSMFLGEAVALLMGPPDQAAMPPEMMVSPITMGVIQAAFLFLVAHGMARIGQLFGGSGDFQGALALIVWLQFIFLVVQVIQLAAMLVVPPVAGLITILAMGLFFWLLVNFIATLHGFSSLGLIFVMTILTAFGFVFVLSLVLTMLGLGFGMN